MKAELHLMLDLETLSTRMNAVILEVGCCLFETNGQSINESGSWYLDGAEQIREKRDVSLDTVEWWMRQSDEARVALFHGVPRVQVKPFIDLFLHNIPWHNIEGVWSHGAGFDIPILEDLHKQWNRVVPWHYRTPRDTRTVFWLAGMKSSDMVPAELKHSAESDAIAQALSVQKALRILDGQSG